MADEGIFSRREDMEPRKCGFNQFNSREEKFSRGGMDGEGGMDGGSRLSREIEGGMGRMGGGGGGRMGGGGGTEGRMGGGMQFGRGGGSMRGRLWMSGMGRGGGGGAGAIYDFKMKDMVGPTYNLPPIDLSEKKFSNRNKVYIGNLKSGSTDKSVREMCEKYGEINELFVNPEKRFAFAKFDYKGSAEKFKNEEDGKEYGERPLKIRFSSNAAAVKVKNLNPMVTNELLFKAFSVFGTVEKAIVTMDEKGLKSKGEGVVEFANKHHAMEAISACRDSPFILTSSLIPAIVEPYEGVESNEGLPEKNINKMDDQYLFERETGPRFIQPGTFDFKFCEKYKLLQDLRKEKTEALEREMMLEEEKLWSQMEFARFEFETEMMKEKVKQMEEERQRRIEMSSQMEMDVNRRLEMERENRKRIANMFDFTIGGNQQMGMNMMNRMSDRIGGGGMGINGGGQGAMNPMMGGESEFRMNPSVWEEFPGENGKRPRYPNEVFGRGGGSAGSSFGRGGSNACD